MSSPAPTPGPAEQQLERRKSFGKYVKRLSTALRRGSSTKASPSSIPEATEPTAEPTAKPAEPAASTPAAAASVPTPAPAPPAPAPVSASASAPAPTTPKVSAEPRPLTTMPTVPGIYVRSAIQQERARALFAKYGLTLESHEWLTTGPSQAVHVERVEKPIRLRIRRTCHRCQTIFGPDRICARCEHKRCKKCPRYPVKKTATGADVPIARGKAVAEIPGLREGRQRAPKLTIVSKSGGELVYQPPKQRIRRTCHKCDTLFIPANATTCSNCSHTRCTKCPRDPAKKKKWPDGYPGDAPAEDSEPEQLLPGKPLRTYRKTRQRVRWTCEVCSTLYKEKQSTCSGCGHERCKTCTRIPPKKAKKEFDPDVIKSVEEKLARLFVSDAQGVSAAESAIPPSAPVPAEEAKSG